MHRQGTTGGSDHQLALVNVGWRACWNKRASDSPLWECLVKPPVFGPMVSAHRIEASIWSVAQRSLRKVFPLTLATRTFLEPEEIPKQVAKR